MISQEIDGDEIDHGSMALGFAYNAISVVHELFVREPSMLSAQALVGITKFYHATSTPQTANVFSAMAARQIYILGLHKDVEAANCGTQSSEWRRRLFWLAYTIDKDYSLRHDQPPSFNDEDLDISLPDLTPSDELGLIQANSVEQRLNYFRLHISLSMIQSKIYKRLYTKRSLKRTAVQHDNLDGVCDLILMLKSWKSAISVNFEPKTLLETFPRSSATAMVILYVRFFNCLAMSHRLSYWKVGHLDSYKARFEKISTSQCISHQMCITAARTSLQLLPILPQGNAPCMWLLIDYLISAAVIMLAGIIYKSVLTLGWEDLRLVEPVIMNLGLLARHGDTERLQHVQANCIELHNAAKDLLEDIDLKETVRC